MKNIYNDLKHSDLGKKVLKMSAILIMIMVWILIDKGNIYGQSHTLKAKAVKSAVGSDVGQSLFKSSDDDDDSITEEDPGSEGENNFDAYPNPFERDLVFDFEFTVRQEQGAPYEVIDVQGKMVEQGTLEPGSAQYRIDLSQLQAGMYFVRVDVGNSLQVQRVIKK